MDHADLHLRPLTEDNLATLLATAVGDAEPLEVMAPVSGPPGWNAARRQAFLDFHRARSIGTDHPVESTYVLVLGDQIVGAARLEPTADAAEAGIWIARSYRGRGIGKAVLTRLRAVAADICPEADCLHHR